MRRILLFGRLNAILKDVDKTLSEYFHVQLCELKADTVEGMLMMVEPDLVIISLVGAQDYDKGIFGILSLGHGKIPVITIGTEQEKEKFLKYYESQQFENLIRPVDNIDILKAVCSRLGLSLETAGGGVRVKDPAQKKNVLIVDDDPVTLRSIKKMLSEDFDVTVATSGIQAMTTIGKRRPDLILLDYEMPVCDGKQTLEMIRADWDLKDMPVIFLTGINDRAHIEAVIKLRPAGYLLKPMARDDLIAIIKKYI